MCWRVCVIKSDTLWTKCKEIRDSCPTDRGQPLCSLSIELQGEKLSRPWSVHKLAQVLLWGAAQGL